MGELPQAKEFLTALELPSDIDFYTDPEGTYCTVRTCSLFRVNNSKELKFLQGNVYSTFHYC